MLSFEKQNIVPARQEKAVQRQTIEKFIILHDSSHLFYKLTHNSCHRIHQLPDREVDDVSSYKKTDNGK